MKLLNKNIFIKAFSLEFLYLIIFYLISKFFIQKIFSIIIIIQTFQGNLDQFQNLDPDAASLAEIQGLRETISQVSGSLNQLILYSVLFTLVLFIAYIIIKSLQWNLIYNKKITNFKKYFLKFTALALLLHMIITTILFNILKYSRTFLIDYMFEGNFLQGPFVRFIILSFLSILITYLFFTSYIHINRLSILKSIKETFKFKKFYLFFILIIISIISALIIKYSLTISSSIISLIIQGILISVLITAYKIYLADKIKKSQ
ncbi:MAG: hypothetical protein ABIB47_02560 [Candidatus Woesearchaeota archaeon]